MHVQSVNNFSVTIQFNRLSGSAVSIKAASYCKERFCWRGGITVLFLNERIICDDGAHEGHRMMINKDF